MSNFELSAEPRSIVGKKVRFLRRQGMVPGNVYGHAASAAIQIPARDVEQTIRRAGRTQLVSLAVKGAEPTTVLVKGWQRHPYKGDLLHVDFYRVMMTETLRMDVPIRLSGEAPAVKLTGGTPFQPLSSLSVECLPGDIPERIEVDVTDLGINDALRISDLPVNEKVKVLDDAAQVVVHVISVKEEVAAPAAGAAPAEGEAAAAATPAEPEVVKKGKKDEEPAEKK